MNIKKIACLLTVATILSSGVITNVYANDVNDGLNSTTSIEQISEQQLTLSEEEQLRCFLSENDVDSETIDNLISKINDGQVWDSLKEEYESIEPTVFKRSSDGSTVTKYVYPDGSIRVTSIEMPVSDQNQQSQIGNGGIISPSFVEGGTWHSGTGYRYVKGARCYVYTGIANATFFADFEIATKGYDKISAAYDQSVVTIGGTYKNLKLHKKGDVKWKEDINGPAYVKLSFDFTATKGVGAQFFWMKLNVGNNNYYTSNSSV